MLKSGGYDSGNKKCPEAYDPNGRVDFLGVDFKYTRTAWGTVNAKLKNSTDGNGEGKMRGSFEFSGSVQENPNPLSPARGRFPQFFQPPG